MAYMSLNDFYLKWITLTVLTQEKKTILWAALDLPANQQGQPSPAQM